MRHKENNYSKYFNFTVLDEIENIMNATELIDNCYCTYVDFRKTPVSFFNKEKEITGWIKRKPHFYTGAIVAMIIYMPESIHEKIIKKIQKDKSYRRVLARCSLGVQMCTIKQINEIINNCFTDDPLSFENIMY